MTERTISALSLEYVAALVSAEKQGMPYDPSGDAVQLSFPATGVSPSAWVSGSWEKVGAAAWRARALVGPGGDVTLAAGVYDVWVKVTDSPEVPAIVAGLLRVR